MKCVGRLATKTWGRKDPPIFFFESIFKKYSINLDTWDIFVFV